MLISIYGVINCLLHFSIQFSISQMKHLKLVFPIRFKIYAAQISLFAHSYFSNIRIYKEAFGDFFS